MFRPPLAPLALALIVLAGTAPARATPEPTSEDRTRALACLAATIAHEAGFEPVEGQEAVAEVVLNRVRDPAWPDTVCGVVFEGASRRTGCQFTFTCDGALARRPPDSVMTGAHVVAARVLDGLAPSRVGGATHYHANYVAPYWAPSLVRVARIGAHIFYRLPGAADRSGGAHSPWREPLRPEVLAFHRSAGPSKLPLRAPVGSSAGASSPPALLAPWGLANVRPAAQP